MGTVILFQEILGMQMGTNDTYILFHSVYKKMKQSLGFISPRIQDKVNKGLAGI